MESLPMYIVKIGDDYLADHVGLFATQELAMAFIRNLIDEDMGYTLRDFQIIRVKPKSEY